MSRILTGKWKPALWLPGLLACAVLQTAAASAATIALAKTAAVNAVAYDDVANRLYFVDENGALWRLQLTPGCEAGSSSCQVTGPMATGLGLAVDIKVNSAAGLAYVINAAGTLWKVDLNSPAPVKPLPIRSGFGAAHLALAPEINSAFVSETDGSLWRVDLSTDDKTDKTLVGNVPNYPGALTVNAARTFAYVSTNNQNRNFVFTITEVDLATGKKTRDIGNIGSNFGPFADESISFGWTDSSEHALYVLVWSDFLSVSDILRVDLTTSETSRVAQFTRSSPVLYAPVQSFAVNPSGSGLYLGAYNSVLRFPLSPAPNGNGQVFLSIGNIPSARIIDGLANTSSTPGAIFRVADSPFGGTLDIFGDLTQLHKYGATSYTVRVTKPNTSAPVPILASWTMYYWNQNPPLAHYEPRLVAPTGPGIVQGAFQGGTYTLPKDYYSPTTAPYWSPTYLMMRYQTSDNGTYIFEIQGFNGSTQVKIPPDQQFLKIQVDNTPPVVTLNSVQDIDGNVVSPCDIVLTGVPNLFKFDLTVSDPNPDGRHLLDYTLRAQWGRNQSATVDSGTFNLGDPGFSSPHLAPAAGWSASCNCAHLFTLQATKRTINGYTHILSASSSEAITINNTGKTCP